MEKLPPPESPRSESTVGRMKKSAKEFSDAALPVVRDVVRATGSELKNLQDTMKKATRNLEEKQSLQTFLRAMETLVPTADIPVRGWTLADDLSGKTPADIEKIKKFCATVTIKPSDAMMMRAFPDGKSYLVAKATLPGKQTVLVEFPAGGPLQGGTLITLNKRAFDDARARVAKRQLKK